MCLPKPVFLLLCFVLAGSGLAAQDYKHMVGHQFTKKEIHEFLLDKSNAYRSQAVRAAVAGPALIGVGIYLISRYNAAPVRGATNATPNRSGEIGALVGVSGALISIYSIPLFILSHNTKKAAALILSNQAGSNGMVSRFMPAVGISIGL